MNSPTISVNNLNLTDPLNKQYIINALIESFVQVYGENHRPRIAGVIQTIDFYFLPTMRIEKGDLSKLAGDIQNGYNRLNFGNPNIINKINKQKIEAMLIKLYPRHEEIVNKY